MNKASSRFRVTKVRAGAVFIELVTVKFKNAGHSIGVSWD